MKYLILLIIFTSCFVPEKGGYFEFRYMKLAEIQKVDSGFDLIWVDGLGREAKVFITDTSGCNYIIGSYDKVMIKR